MRGTWRDSTGVAVLEEKGFVQSATRVRRRRARVPEKQGKRRRNNSGRVICKLNDATKYSEQGMREVKCPSLNRIAWPKRITLTRPWRQPCLTSKRKNQWIKGFAITRLPLRKYCGAAKPIVNTCAGGGPTLCTRRGSKKSARRSDLQPEDRIRPSRQAWRTPWDASARCVTCERRWKKLRGSSLRHSRAEATYKYGCLTAGAVDGAAEITRVAGQACCRVAIR